jgi:hypothetical protein
MEDKSVFFQLPLSVEAYGQYQTLLTDLGALQPNETNDT